MNLVGNAVKFTEQGAVEVRVGLGAGVPDSSERVRLHFSVRDTGIGIPTDQLDSIFESFSQVKRSSHAKYGGTGLGLSISKQIVELMGGEIWAESEPGRGSVFSFTAEFGRSEVEKPEAGAPAAVPEPAVRPLRILVAEDNPINQLFVREILESEGHTVSVAGDGREVLDALAREPFDLVLLDVQMPEMDGLETARRIREGTVPGVPTDIPLIALTAHAIKGDRERFLAAGMDDYLSKPLDTDDLAQALARVNGGRVQGVAPPTRLR